MKSALKRVVLIGMAAAMLALSLFQVAGAIGTHTGNSNGCAGWGLTYIISSDYSYTKTDATFDSGCANSYSVGYFWDGSVYAQSGPGWVTGSVALSEWFEDVAGYSGTGVYGYHRFCSSGQSCTGGTWITTAP